MLIAPTCAFSIKVPQSGHYRLVEKKLGSKELSFKTKTVRFRFSFQVSPPPLPTQEYSLHSSERRNPSSDMCISSEEKKRNEALCGREDTNGDPKQNGLKQLIWRGLKLLNDGKIVVKSKLFP